MMEEEKLSAATQYGMLLQCLMQSVGSIGKEVLVAPLEWTEDLMTQVIWQGAVKRRRREEWGCEKEDKMMVKCEKKNEKKSEV